MAETAPIYDLDAIHHPVAASHGMVATQEAVASAVGAEILKRGGNAVDAAVAVGFALAVTLPRAGNIGGGGFMLVYLADQHKTLAIDYREMAPAAAYPAVFLDKDGNVDTEKARFSYMSSGVPGTVAGLALALQKYGTMSLKEVMRPAIKLADEGFAVTGDFEGALSSGAEKLGRNEASRAIFFHQGGTPYRRGEIFRNKDLAHSLRLIAAEGPKAFYEGEIARRMADAMAKNGGLITLEDLKNYKVIEREPLHGSYRGYEIVTMPPPSSGGVHIIQILNILSHFPIRDWGYGSAKTIHVMAEAMKLAYADRSKYLGDPDFTRVPVKGLTSPDYAAALAKTIPLDHARPSAEIQPGNPMPYESPSTTHFSVMDSKGNAVSNTYTLNFSFGSHITIPGTGILMNNEMDDFSSKPGTANAFGLLGDTANQIEGKKRPLSSMTPTIVFKDNKPYLVTGSPGGSTIITAVLQTIVNVIDHGMNIADAVAAPRLHHQWMPDQLKLEPGFSPDTILILKSMGYDVAATHVMGSEQSIIWQDGLFLGAADPRRPAAAAVGY
jgi:gamma-glutamyltranspeptidase/glutathione hydrolase